MLVNVGEVFARGGRGLVDLLEFCVISVRTDALFVFLAGEYRLLPTTPRAVVLFDIFCDRDAPARLSVARALPPYDLRLPAAIRPLRESMERATHRLVAAEDESSAGIDSSEEAGAAEAQPPPVLMPPRYIFDEVVRQLEASPRGQLRELGAAYDPSRSPRENLPGGRMTPGQLAFVERVWVPRVRPRLVAAGFRRIADIA